MHARHYGVPLGRFLSVDTRLGNLGAPQTWNRYRYAAGNPLLLVDHDGRAPQAFFVETGTSYGLLLPSFLDPVDHSAIYIRDPETLPPIDVVFSNGWQPAPVGPLSDYLSTYGPSDITRLYPLRLRGDQVESLHASLRYHFRPIGDSGITHVPAYDTFLNNCAQFAVGEILAAASSSGMQQVGFDRFVETITGRASVPVLTTQQALLLLSKGRLITSPWGLNPAQFQIIFYLRHAPSSPK